MKRSWLIQRLTKPRSGGIFGPANPFAFGGGLRNGGLSDDAMRALRGVFSFDYMGAAEFEFGAVPKALSGMAADSKRLRAFCVEVEAERTDWRTRKASSARLPVYVVCRDADKAEVTARICEWAAKELHELKEQPRLAASLLPVEDWDSDVQGWLELDNGFAFFADREMWDGFCNLFGVKSEAVTQ